MQIVHHSQVLSPQEGSLWELACEVKPAGAFDYSFFLVFKLSCLLHLFWTHLQGSWEQTDEQVCECWDCRRIDILKVNIETFHPEDATAATDTDTTSDR